MDDQLAEELKQAELAVAQAEKELGPNHPELADKLQKYANLLRKTEKRALDAVNVEARARAIRAKMYAEQEAAQRTSPKTAAGKVKRDEAPRYASIGLALGVAGVFAALATLLINQNYMVILIPLAIACAVADLVMSRSGLWRAALVVVFSIASWASNQSLPSNMLIDSTPIERFTYASENPDIVENVRHLGKPVRVLNYSLNMPDAYTQISDEVKPWGRVLTFAASGPGNGSDNASSNSSDNNNTAFPAGTNGGATAMGARVPKMYFILVKLPPEQKNQKVKPSLLKLARDQALPPVAETLQLTHFSDEQPRQQEINGISFARVGFTGENQMNPTSGFTYVSVQSHALIAITGSDLSINGDSNLGPMEASIYTLQKRSSEAPALE